ncbi:MAG: O-antigen ligase family protein [Pseudomonas sp.]|jgi:O-antigen ligase|nr:O-antigen ligase family protein [Pseudomonas sp.]
MHTEIFKKKTENGLIKVLTLGVFFVLTGLLFLEKSSNYHTVYYILILTPVILASIIHPNQINENLPLITKIFILFAAWSTLSILWSDTQESMLTPIKRALYILCLFLSFSIINKNNKNMLLKVFIFSGAAIALISAYSLYTFQMTHQPGSRFIGTGALSNPLLSSHIFGLFSVLFLTLSLTTRSIKIRFIYLTLGTLLVLAVVATGSRTPLLALVAAAAWLSLILKNKKSVIIIAYSAVVLACIYLLYPEAILSRGLSYRPELWSVAIEEILSKPIWGYGFDSSSRFYISSLDIAFREPHNIHLSILYFTGIIGFTLWCAMYACALWACWKNKTDTLFIIGSALLVYGIAAGMTEGGGLLPRPKEHWFITWIPLAFVSALLSNKAIKLKTKELVNKPPV